jgi:hypothetical protein
MGQWTFMRDRVITKECIPNSLSYIHVLMVVILVKKLNLDSSYELTLNTKPVMSKASVGLLYKIKNLEGELKLDTSHHQTMSI